VKRNLRTLTLALTATAVLVPAGAALASHSQHRMHWDHAALWASPTGTGTSCTHAAPCSLSTALGSAASGATVRAMKGTYLGGVMIDAKVKLAGQRGAVLNAATSADGVGIQVAPGGSGSSIHGFTIENAPTDGILVGSEPGPGAAPVTNVDISGNTLTANGAAVPKTPGWAIWMVTATNSTVANNRIYKNAGGILLSDENGRSSHNRIIGNRVDDSTLQCGITLAGHNPAAINPVTFAPTPTTGGVFDNLVADNVTNDNATAPGTYGGGIILAAGAPFGGVYSNVIRDNTANGNGMPGILIHEHNFGPGTGSDLNNKVIVGNHLSNDNLVGDPDVGATPLTATTGILVASLNGAITPITGTVIAHNRISHVQFGIWTLDVSGTTNTIAHNRFAKSVTTPISAN
jgi:parallel beta-helix repeat protein